MIITLEGNIGVGKSTFAAALCDKLKELGFDHILHIKEPVDKWINFGGTNLLQTYYEDKLRWAFTFQANALADAVQNEFKASNHSFDGGIVVMERSSFSVCELFTEMLATENLLQPLEVDIMRKLVNTLPKHLLSNKDNVVIYLRAEPETCYQRIVQRNRPEEVGKVSLDYIKKLHNIHEQKISAENVYGQLMVLDGAKDSWWIKLDLEGEGFYVTTDSQA